MRRGWDLVRARGGDPVANALPLAAGLALAVSGGPLRGAARALRAAVVCGLLSPLILIAGRLLGMRFR